jgi:hypothetical protein
MHVRVRVCVCVCVCGVIPVYPKPNYNSVKIKSTAI